MSRIVVHTELRVLDARNRPIVLSEIVPLLEQIRSQGSIAQAAKQLGLSYRRAWAMLGEVEASLGGTLMRRERGRGSVLSELGEKILRANRQREQQFAPLSAALSRAISRDLAVAARHL